MKDPRKCSKYTSRPSASALNAVAAASVRCMRPARTLRHQRFSARSGGFRRRSGRRGSDLIDRKLGYPGRECA